MAYTRSEIITLVNDYTRKGTDKATLINTLCNQALRYAALVYDFSDTRETISPDTIITAGDMGMPVPADMRTPLSIRLIDSNSTAGTYLKLKTSQWWDSHIVNPANNVQGWPVFGLRDRKNILFERPSKALTARFRITKIPEFHADADVCPIEVLDLFVLHYVIAHVFKSIEDMENFFFHITKALGSKRQRDNNEVGGLLLQAIQADARIPAEELKAGYPSNYQNAPVLHTTGDLGSKSWFLPN